MGKVCRHIRKRWSQENLEAALMAIRNGESQRNAGSKFNIPRRTLRRYIHWGIALKRLGRPSVLSPQQEKDFVKRIIRFCEVGLPLTLGLVRHQAFRYCEINKIPHNFNKIKECAGKDWLQSFLHRHPELSKRKAQAMNPARVQKLNRMIVKDYFQKLEDILNNMGLKSNPQNIYNMDEKGCRLTIHHQQSVMARKGSKRVHMVAPEHAENVTVVGCCNAIGNAIPPMVIFKGKRLKPEFQDNLPPGSLVQMAPKGSMTTSLFIKFIEHLSRHKTAGPILLVFDGASSHLHYSIVDFADEKDITLFCLPSNTTHELQPLDKAVYRSFEAHWDQELFRYWDTYPEKHLNKPIFNIISRVWPKCMTPENIQSGFRATGLYPFDPSAIPDCAFAPSLVSELPLPANILENKSQTEETSDSDDNIALATLKQKLQKANDEHVAKTLNMSFQELLPTPHNKNSKIKKVRRKAINYKAQKVTKDLFNNETTCTSTIPCTSKVKPSVPASQPESWYCPACGEDKQIDMRMCIICSKYYHEERVGIAADDSSDFVCFDCM